MPPGRVLVSWSGGKDCALALHELQRAGYEIAALVTTVTIGDDRVAIHEVRRALIERQASSLGVPLRVVPLRRGASNAEYESAMATVFDEFRPLGIGAIAFADLFLADIKMYRDQFLSREQMRGLYPVWQRDTATFVRDFIALGFKAIVTSVDGRALDVSFAGRTIDAAFLADLPTDIDPCGENGEFHTFVFDGPNFATPIAFEVGALEQHESYWSCDLRPR
jgi:uncharacterized protein (TIGR00290 family)